MDAAEPVTPPGAPGFGSDPVIRPDGLVIGPDGLVIGPDGLVRPAWAYSDAVMLDYYDTEWGMPVRDEQGLFERLSLEVFQSGLSWATILRKRPAFREAFHDFDPDVVAAFGPDDEAALLANPGIVRNRRKIAATVHNARATIALRAEGGLPTLIWAHRPGSTPTPTSMRDAPSRTPESVELAARLKAVGFRHVGPTMMFALMEAVGVVDTHPVACHRRASSGRRPSSSSRDDVAAAEHEEPDADGEHRVDDRPPGPPLQR